MAGLAHRDRDLLDRSAVERITRELHSAFTTVGFVCLKNHGIQDELVCIMIISIHNSYTAY